MKKFLIAIAILIALFIGGFVACAATANEVVNEIDKSVTSVDQSVSSVLSSVDQSVSSVLATNTP